jgi:general secretion pathway protein E
MNENRKTLEALQKAGLISEVQAAVLESACETEWRPPAEVVRRQSGIEEDRLAAWAAEYVGVPYLSSLSGFAAPEEYFQKVPPEYARQVGAVAHRITEDKIEVVVALGPDMHAVVAELSVLFERPVAFMIAPRREIEAAVDRSVRQQPEYLEYAAGELPEDEFAESAARIERVTDFAELMRKTPVVKLVSLLVAQAVRSGASDIHFQPTGDRLRVRFRTDGILHDVLDLPRSSQDAILSRVKVLGKMDIAERRSPQDGRASFRYADREIDVRMSVIPTDEGERAVLRLLDKEQKLLKLEEVGLSDRNLTEFERLIKMSHGMILVTGPTGSGKTTTLYAALMKINSPEENIITIEDPVEYKVPGISQIQVLPRKNVTFGSMLRSVVRQDPDINMIGEIRDEETASIAVQSSLTGHLVFSTLHTNDSAGAIARLLDLGVEPFLLSSSLLAVLAQRLVRRVCPACGRPDAVSAADLALLNLGVEQGRHANLRRGAGCDQCLATGYRGRLGIFELLLVDDAVRPLINRRASASEIREAGMRNGLTLLRADGAGKALAGLTTVEEVLRVTQRDDETTASVTEISQPPSAAAQS